MSRINEKDPLFSYKSEENYSYEEVSDSDSKIDTICIEFKNKKDKILLKIVKEIKILRKEKLFNHHYHFSWRKVYIWKLI